MLRYVSTTWTSSHIVAPYPTPTLLRYKCGQPIIWSPLSYRRRLLTCSWQPAVVFYGNSILPAVFPGQEWYWSKSSEAISFQEWQFVRNFKIWKNTRIIHFTRRQATKRFCTWKRIRLGEIAKLQGMARVKRCPDSGVIVRHKKTDEEIAAINIRIVKNHLKFTLQ